MRFLFFLVVFIPFLVFMAWLMIGQHRSRSYVAQIAAQRAHHLELASRAYEQGKPGLAAEHEATATVLLDRMRRLKAGDESARIG